MPMPKEVCFIPNMSKIVFHKQLYIITQMAELLIFIDFQSRHHFIRQLGCLIMDTRKGSQIISENFIMEESEQELQSNDLLPLQMVLSTQMNAESLSQIFIERNKEILAKAACSQNFIKKDILMLKIIIGAEERRRKVYKLRMEERQRQLQRYQRLQKAIEDLPRQTQQQVAQTLGQFKSQFQKTTEKSVTDAVQKAFDGENTKIDSVKLHVDHIQSQLKKQQGWKIKILRFVVHFFSMVVLALAGILTIRSSQQDANGQKKVDKLGKDLSISVVVIAAVEQLLKLIYLPCIVPWITRNVQFFKNYKIAEVYLKRCRTPVSWRRSPFCELIPQFLLDQDSCLSPSKWIPNYLCTTCWCDLLPYARKEWSADIVLS